MSDGLRGRLVTLSAYIPITRTLKSMEIIVYTARHLNPNIYTFIICLQSRSHNALLWIFDEHIASRRKPIDMNCRQFIEKKVMLISIKFFQSAIEIIQLKLISKYSNNIELAIYETDCFFLRIRRKNCDGKIQAS